MSSVFKIFSPEDCDFYYDGELQGHIVGNNDRSFRFEVEKKGTYRFKFVNSKHKSELRETHTIGENEEKIIDLDFTEVNEVIIKAEAEKPKAEKTLKTSHPLKIQYTRPTTPQVMQLMSELEKRRTSTFPFTILVHTTLESHGCCKLDTKQIQRGIIKLTIDPEMTDAEYQKILDWLLSKI